MLQDGKSSKILVLFIMTCHLTLSESPDCWGWCPWLRTSQKPRAGTFKQGFEPWSTKTTLLLPSGLQIYFFSFPFLPLFPLPLCLQISTGSGDSRQHMLQFEFLILTNHQSMPAVWQTDRQTDCQPRPVGALHGLRLLPVQIHVYVGSGDPLSGAVSAHMAKHSLSYEPSAFTEIHEVFSMGLWMRQEFPPGAQHQLAASSHGSPCPPLPELPPPAQDMHDLGLTMGPNALILVCPKWQRLLVEPQTTARPWAPESEEGGQKRPVVGWGIARLGPHCWTARLSGSKCGPRSSSTMPGAFLGAAMVEALGCGWQPEGAPLGCAWSPLDSQCCTPGALELRAPLII